MQLLRNLLFSVFSISLLVITPGQLRGQGHQPVFPDLTGEPLIQSVREAYRPAFVLDFSNARDTLFGRIYAHNDTLTCVYSGHQLYLDPTADPTSWAYQNGALWGINTEHTWPRAKGADNGAPRADMHHLHPTRIAVNAARGNDPFAEIDDAQTDQWFYLTMVQSTTPMENIDLYSEKITGYFEPREDHKGNVARAMLYFYTVYRQEADAADPNFFEVQRVTFCQWHYQDPVDQLEWERTWQIATYQDGKPNPFVLDCTLPARSYCQDLDLNCDPVSSTQQAEPQATVRWGELSPNPAHGLSQFSFSLTSSARIRVDLYDSGGAYLGQQDLGRQGAGEHRWTLDPNRWPSLPSGLVFCRFRADDGRRIYQHTARLIHLP